MLPLGRSETLAEQILLPHFCTVGKYLSGCSLRVCVFALFVFWSVRPGGTNRVDCRARVTGGTRAGRTQGNWPACATQTDVGCRTGFGLAADCGQIGKAAKIKQPHSARVIKLSLELITPGSSPHLPPFLKPRAHARTHTLSLPFKLANVQASCVAL